MRYWNHSRFSVYKEVYVGKVDVPALVKLAKHILHPPFSQDKIKHRAPSLSKMWVPMMKTISFIQVYEEIKKILKHLGFMADPIPGDAG